MGVIRLEHSTVVVSLAAALSLAALPHAQTSTGGLSGRWECTIDTPAPAAAGARGSATAAQGPATRTVTLNLTVGAGGTVSGTVAISGSGRGGGPGGNPARPVEISDGKADKTRVSFSVWQFDGYTNRTRYDGIVEGDRLTLTMTRETASGTERTQAVAVRESY
jgi:hypothetical protein